METTESFSIKLEQILPWQDGQYAEVFLGIRDYDEISAKMSEEVKTASCTIWGRTFKST